MMSYVHTFLAILPYLLIAVCIFLATSAKDKLTEITWLLWSVIFMLIIIGDVIVKAKT